jgi:hypothetical protein
MTWHGGDDSWHESDVSFYVWLKATTRFRRDVVLAEALTVREPKPQPHPRPRPPRPRPAPRITAAPADIPAPIDTFTDQQTRLAERLLGINNTKEK